MAIGILHITSGDIAGDSLARSGIPGEVLVWHDILYDGPRKPGWPDESGLCARAAFLERATGGGLKAPSILDTLRKQYEKLAAAEAHERIVLWFDACLFDQSMLAHILTCMPSPAVRKSELLCVDSFPGIVPFNGLGQLQPSQMAAVYGRRTRVTDGQVRFAMIVDRAFAVQDPDRLVELAGRADAPLPWMPAAIGRWLQERPDPATGLGRLEFLALQAIGEGAETPWQIFNVVAAADTPPQYWGDITLWAKINALADRTPPLVRIEGPATRLPQWEGVADLKQFRITLPSPHPGRKGV